MITTLERLAPDFRNRERKVICDAINWFGDASHPAADLITLPHFGVPYVLTCLTHYVKNISNVTADFDNAMSALDEISRAKGAKGVQQ